MEFISTIDVIFLWISGRDVGSDGSEENDFNDSWKRFVSNGESRTRVVVARNLQEVGEFKICRMGCCCCAGVRFGFGVEQVDEFNGVELLLLLLGENTDD